MKIKIFLIILFSFYFNSVFSQNKELIKDIERKIRNHDKSVLDDIFTIKARFLDSTFAALLKDKNEETKMLTLFCVTDLGMLYLPRVKLQIYDLLSDKSNSIRLSTLRLLNDYVTAKDFPAIKKAYTFAEDPLYKRELALFMGDIKDLDIAELKKLQMDASNLLVKDGLQLALAKKGDNISRNKITIQFRNADTKNMRSLFDFTLHYLMQDWMVKDLSYLINKKDTIATDDLLMKTNQSSSGLNNSTSNVSSGSNNMARRTCDLYVDYIMDVCTPRPQFSFKNKLLQYNDRQLAEVSRFVMTYKIYIP